mgnify:FL=1
MDPKQHAEKIDQVMQDIQDGVFDNLKALENRLAEIVSTSGGNIQALRPSIVQEFNKYSASVKAESQTVREIALDTIGEGTVTVEDETAISALSDAMSNSVANEVTNGAEGVITALTLATAAGVGTDALVKTARARVSGVFMETDDALAKKAQRKLTGLLRDGKATAAEVAEATRVIKDRLNDVNVTSSVRDLASKKVNDTVMQFDGAFTKGRAKRQGVKRYRYEGGIVRSSRDWCQEHQGQTYTEDEIYDIWNSSWPGKEPGDPFVVRGGYNCRHFWVPIEDE